MGWASGSYVMSGIIEAAKKHIPDRSTREVFYSEVIAVLQAEDWDTESECLGEDPAYDAEYNRRFPE